MNKDIIFLDLDGVCADFVTAVAKLHGRSSPSNDPIAAAGKVMWLHRHIGPNFESYAITGKKSCCARRGAVLLDDSKSECKLFFERGGCSVLFPQPWNGNNPPRSVESVVSAVNIALMC